MIKLTFEEAEEVRGLRHSSKAYTVKTIAEKYGVTEDYIQEILSRIVHKRKPVCSDRRLKELRNGMIKK